MSEVSGALIARLPVEFIMLIMVAALVYVIYILPKVRRDKNGKLYIYSRKYEANQKKQKQFLEMLNRLEERLTKTDEAIKNLTKKCAGRGRCLDDVREKLARLEILDMLSHAPHKKEQILKAYDVYKKNGYNGWMDKTIADWKEQNKTSNAAKARG